MSRKCSAKAECLLEAAAEGWRYLPPHGDGLFQSLLLTATSHGLAHIRLAGLAKAWFVRSEHDYSTVPQIL